MATAHNPNLLDLVECPVGADTLVGTVVEMLGGDALLIETSNDEGIATGLHRVPVRDAKVVWQAMSDATLKPDAVGRIAFEEGLLSLQNGMIELAREKFAEAFKADPHLAGTLMNLASDRAQKGGLESALVVYDLILRLQPENALVRENLSITRLNRGVEFGRVGNLEQAIVEFNAAMLLRPSTATFNLAQRNLAAGYTHLGVRHSNARLFNEALKFFLFAFQFWLSEDSARNLGLAFASTSALKNRSPEIPNQEYFLNSFWLGVTYSECLNAYGATLAQIGERSAALDALEGAVAADPKNQLASRNLQLVRGWGDSMSEVPPLNWGIKAVPLDEMVVSLQ